jgi:hypothetical protein
MKLTQERVANVIFPVVAVVLAVVLVMLGHWLGIIKTGTIAISN